MEKELIYPITIKMRQKLALDLDTNPAVERGLAQVHVKKGSRLPSCQ
jgi:hypothetical protein